jgi:hypothetical protein
LATIVEADRCPVLAAPPLQLAFQSNGIRWAHTLRVGDTLVAASVEWEPERDDVDRMISPAYQHLATSQTDGGPQAMVLGQWGRHHGSGTFLVAKTATGAVVDVDVAVRTKAPLAAMACTYHVDLSSSALVEADASAIAWALSGPPGGVLRFEPGSSAEQVVLAEAGRRGVKVQVSCSSEGSRPTRRLRYRWRWNPTRDDTYNRHGDMLL